MPDGLTVLQYLEAAQPDAAIRACLSVRLCGHVIPRENWHLVRPKPGMLIEAVPLPGDGNTLRIVLAIAIVAAAMALGGYIAGPAVLGFATGSTGFVFASAAIGGALTLGGMLALNALIPPPSEQMDGGSSDTSQTYGLEGASNSARLNAPIPMILGNHRFVPDLAAPWVTLLEGDVEYLYGLLCWGFGPGSVQMMQIGDTPLARFRGVETETYSGDTNESPTFTLYPRSVTTTSIGTLLAAGHREIRNTDTDTKFALVEFQFRGGAIKYSESTGDELGVTINLRMRWRAAGTEEWSPEINVDLVGKQASPKRLTRRIDFPTQGEYEIEIWRTTGDHNESGVADKVHWENIKSINHNAPIADMQGVILTAIKIQASEQLNGVIRDLSGVVTSYGLAWNGSTWVYGPTNDPAALFRRFLQGPNMREPVPDSRLDLPQLQHWSRQAAIRTQACNFVVDREMSVWDVLSIIAATGDATPTRVGGKWSVVIDEERLTPVALLTERNIKSFKGRRIFVEDPHALRAKFSDQTDDFRQQTRIIYSDDYDASNATRFEDTEFPGVTDPDQVWRMGRRRLAEGRLRCQTFTWEMDFENLLITRGDMVAIQHGAALWGRSTGRIAGVVIEGGEIVAFDLDEVVVFDQIGDFVMRVRRSNNTQAIYDIQQPVGDATRVILTPPIPTSENIFRGDLYAIGVRNREVQQLIVRAIEPISDLRARITAIPYAPGVFTAHLRDIPPWDPLTTPRPGRLAPIIRSVVSSDAASVRNPDGSMSVRVIVLLYDDGTRPLTRIRGIEVAWKPVTTTGAFTIIPCPADAIEVPILGASIGETIRITARYVMLSGGYGPWGYEVQHEVEGPRIPPTGVTGLILEGYVVRWNYSPGPDHAGFRVRFAVATGVEWQDAEDVTDALVTEYSLPTAEFPIGTKLVLVKAVTVNGIETAQAATLEVDITEAEQRVLLEVADLRELNWPGSLTGGERVGGELRTIDTSVWLENARAQWLTPELDDWLSGAWSSMVYIANVQTPTNLRAGDRMFLRFDIQGEAKVAYRWGTSDLTYHPLDEAIPDDFLDIGDLNLPLGSAGGIGLLVWRAWRQGTLTIPNQPLQIRIIIAAGAGGLPLVRQFRVEFDAEEIEESFGSLDIPVEGVTLPIRKIYRTISYIVGSIHAGSSAIGVAIDSRDTASPRIHLVNAQGQAVAGVADVRLGGG